MTEKKLGIGDKVRVTGKIYGPTGWSDEMDDMIGKTYTISAIGAGLGKWYQVGGSDKYFTSEVLEPVKSHVARILTEKVTIDGVPCRKIMGFEGILSREELPDKYNNGLPEFSFDKDERSAHRFVFNGKDVHLSYSELSRGVLHFHVPDAEPKIESYGFYMAYMNIGDVLPEKTFQQILVWLKRAGSRLAKIRKQEKAAWSGKETIEI